MDVKEDNILRSLDTRIERMDVKVERLISDVSNLNDNFAARVQALEQEKLDKQEADRLLAEANVAHEKFDARLAGISKRVSFHDKVIWSALGIIGAIEFLARVFPALKAIAKVP